MTQETSAPVWAKERLSATTTLSVTQYLVILLIFAVCQGAFLWPVVFFWIHISLGIGFLAATAFRLWCVSAVLFERNQPQNTTAVAEFISEDQWPRYTVVLALYNEAHMVPTLLSAIHALDYPQDRIEILVATEADDHKTAAACRLWNGNLPVILVNGSGDGTEDQASRAERGSAGSARRHHRCVRR